jgi:predicted RNA binding protein YcfA (HicA-like mRNA interferase family)
VPPLPVVSAPELIVALQRAGFYPLRQRGSHVRLRHADGRVVTVPLHGSRDVGRGLLRKILRDADLSVAELLNLLGR